MSPYDFLREYAEPVPEWLLVFQSGNRFDRKSFFSSRAVYYPGANDDGHPVKLFGSTSTAHVFVYVDFASHWTQAWLIDRLGEHPRRFRGYHLLGTMDLSEEDLGPHSCRPSIQPRNPKQPKIPRFGLVTVLERDYDHAPSHGPERLAILFLCDDGFAAFDALYCQRDGTPPPFAVVLEDHAFGGNDDQFGGGGLLETLANNAGVFPRWLLVAERTNPWRGYERMLDVDGDRAGMHGRLRFLHQQQ